LSGLIEIEKSKTTPIHHLEAHPKKSSIEIRSPVATDGASVFELVGGCPPLDVNSRYANLIQCTHFSGTCAIALESGAAIGWLSGHMSPQEPDTFFVWQVAVRADKRGLSLARKMLHHILRRPANRAVRRVNATITEGNVASWRLFESFAARLDAPMRREAFFDRERHFAGHHESEFLITIGPIGVMPNTI
jgi:L-2,4-diaminobutyric acid acetyltransferase